MPFAWVLHNLITQADLTCSAEVRDRVRQYIDEEGRSHVTKLRGQDYMIYIVPKPVLETSLPEIAN